MRWFSNEGFRVGYNRDERTDSPGGYHMAGFRGRGSSFIDAIGIVCANPSNVANQGEEPVESRSCSAMKPVPTERWAISCVELWPFLQLCLKTCGLLSS